VFFRGIIYVSTVSPNLGRNSRICSLRRYRRPFPAATFPLFQDPGPPWSIPFGTIALALLKFLGFRRAH